MHVTVDPVGLLAAVACRDICGGVAGYIGRLPGAKHIQRANDAQYAQKCRNTEKEYRYQYVENHIPTPRAAIGASSRRRHGQYREADEFTLRGGSSIATDLLKSAQSPAIRDRLQH